MMRNTMDDFDFDFDVEDPEFDEIQFGHLMKVAEALEDQEFPDYCLEDKFFLDPEYPVTIKCFNQETNEELHVVLISSFDGISWWAWHIEKQAFEILELDLDEE